METYDFRRAIEAGHRPSMIREAIGRFRIAPDPEPPPIATERIVAIEATHADATGLILAVRVTDHYPAGASVTATATHLLTPTAGGFAVRSLSPLEARGALAVLIESPAA